MILTGAALLHAFPIIINIPTAAVQTMLILLCIATPVHTLCGAAAVHLLLQ
jgi:hypothetical protein